MENMELPEHRRNRILGFTVVAMSFVVLLGLLVAANVIAYNSTEAMPVVVMLSLMILMFGVVLFLAIYHDILSGMSLRTLFCGPACLISVAYIMAALNIIGAVYFVNADLEYNGQPGDGVVSRGEWHNFVTYNVDQINSGNNISDDAHGILCGGFGNMMASLLDKDDALVILTYCAGATDILDRHTAITGDRYGQFNNDVAVNGVRPDGPACAGLSGLGVIDPDTALSAIGQCHDYMRILDRDTSGS